MLHALNAAVPYIWLSAFVMMAASLLLTARFTRQIRDDSRNLRTTCPRCGKLIDQCTCN